MPIQIEVDVKRPLRFSRQ